MDAQTCKENMGGLQAKLEQLLAIEKLLSIEGIELVKNRDIVSYLEKNGFIYGKKGVRGNVAFGADTKVSIVECNGNILLRIPLPIRNSLWTFAAFSYVEEFCRVFGNCCPVHGCVVPDGKSFLYIIIDGKYTNDKWQEGPTIEV